VAALLVPGLASAQPYTFVSTPASDTLAVVDLSSHTVVDTVPLGGGLPSDCAVGPHGARLYAALSESNALAMIDMASGALTTVPVGAGPTGVAVGGSGRRVYVANTAGGTVSVIDPARALVVATIPVGDTPFDAVAGGRHVYVANWGAHTVSVIDVSTNAVVGAIPVGRFPAGLALHRATRRLYVANFFDDTVSVVDTGSLSVVSTIQVARRPRALAVDATGQSLYVAGFEDSRVQIVNTSTGTVATEAASGGLNPMDLMLGPDGTRLYVAHVQETQGLVVLDATALTAVTTVGVAAGPFAFAGLSATRPPETLGARWRAAARALAGAVRAGGDRAASAAPRSPESRGVEDVVIGDSEFALADWVVSGGGEHTTTQEATGGNPGAWRRTTHFGPANTAHVLIRPGAAYDPAQGAIQTVDVSWDRRLLAESVALEGFLVQQNGVIYRSTERALFLPNWQTDSRAGLVASDFDNGTGGQPDFTTDGSPIRFGYFRRTTTGQTLPHGIDNFVVTVHPLGTNLAGTLTFEKSLITVKENEAPFITVGRVGGTLGAVGAEVLTERPDGSTQVDVVTWNDGDASMRSVLILGLDLDGSGARTARLRIQNPVGGVSIHSTRGVMSIAVFPLNWGPALELLYLRLLGLLSAFSPLWLLALAAPAVLAAWRSRGRARGADAPPARARLVSVGTERPGSDAVSAERSDQARAPA
jgi:YVTN family beta-propeller protein